MAEQKVLKQAIKRYIKQGKIRRYGRYGTNSFLVDMDLRFEGITPSLVSEVFKEMESMGGGKNER
ncbi:MAG: hypothetical protein DRP09_17280 [Candidatus Thorarchaeota archaeon]|nr:MAG: hypothetical protein DRP09_17280 [Candidatus Thorarchaeota archaeon]